MRGLPHQIVVPKGRQAVPVILLLVVVDELRMQGASQRAWDHPGQPRKGRKQEGFCTRQRKDGVAKTVHTLCLRSTFICLYAPPAA